MPKVRLRDVAQSAGTSECTASRVLNKRLLDRDASSLYHYRRMPLPVTEGYYHWRDCLPEFEKELETARKGGIKALLEAAGKNAKLSMEWNAAALNTEEI